MITALAVAILAAAPPPRAALIVLDAGPRTGAIQRDLMETLVRNGVRVVSAEEIGDALSSERPAPTSGDDAVKQIAAARTALYDGRTAEAATLLDAVLTAADGEPFASLPRGDALLWRIAVDLAQEQKATAESHALAALRLDPALSARADVFPPDVARVLEEVRNRTATVDIRVDVHPEHAKVSINGRVVRGRATTKVVVGEHRVAVSARGYQPWRGLTKLSPERDEIGVGLVPAGGIEPQLRSGFADSNRAEVAERLRQLSADVLFAVLVDERGVTVHRARADGAIETSPPFPIADRSAIRQWLLDHARSRQKQRSAALTVEAGASFARAHRRVSGDPLPGPIRPAQPSMAHGTSGGGLEVRVRRRSQHVALGFELAALDFGATEVTYANAEGDVEKTSGGSRVLVALDGGWGGTAAGVSWIVGARLEGERSFGDDAGGVFPLHQRFAAGPAGEIGWSPASGRLSLFLALSLTAGTWDESPAGATGEAGLSVGGAWRAGITARASDRWRISIAYSGTRRQVAFEGESGAGLNLVDAVATDGVDQLSLTFARTF